MLGVIKAIDGGTSQGIGYCLSCKWLVWLESMTGIHGCLLFSGFTGVPPVSVLRGMCVSLSVSHVKCQSL